ncbi:type IV pilus modification PilV family protein [Vreelandella olivaria]|uniref:type IV pilus modification PilV family protein n=1 Tax=Vreelandella olivaria TaxID=390919 RepID=UPI00201EFC50|nr:prepilin-type N-terminal cleavage/methylation domain-containing protein [Halomonas olivaria]
MNHQHGFSLVESLVALAILAFGLIGVAAIQLKALQSAHAGYQSALVNVAAIDAQERLWAALADSNSCLDISLGAVESAWKSHWFLNPDTAVLPQVNSALSGISNVGCHFTLRIYWSPSADEEAVELVYEFRLPTGS